MDQSRVVSQAFQSVKWASLGSILPRLVTPISTMVLAALLVPKDFGVVAAAMIVISFAQILTNMGIGAAIIQRQNAVSEAASLALGLSLLSAVGLYVILWFISPWAARAYRIPELTSVLRVVSLSLILSALVTVPIALLQKEMAFRKLFWINAVPQVVGAGISVGFAAAGSGYWALVIGYLAGQVMNLGLAWKACRWRPRWSMNFSLLPGLFRFSVWIMISGFQSWLFLYASNALAGYFFGAQVLGVYSLGFNVATLLPGLFISALASVAYPAFCALQGEGPRAIGLRLVKVLEVSSAAVIPLTLGISAIAISGVRLLYGNRWSGLGMTIQWMAVMPGIGLVWSVYADAFRSVGRPETWVKLAFISWCFLFVLLLLVGRSNFATFVVVRSLGEWLYPVLNILFARRVLKITVREQFRAVAAPFSISLLTYGIMQALVRILSSGSGLGGWAGLAVAVFAGGLTYWGVLRLSRPGLYQQLSLSVRRIFLTA